ncbi:Dipeptidyl aminopeptidase 4 [Paramyrothecium foliicola]|nr:Dipeptidyl aminopeptidase 4 [Paramyrothecium foliicola]
MLTVEDRLIQQATVEPHWLADGDSFWYRHQTSPETSEFIFVDASEKLRRQAFDHIALADALGRQTGTTIEAGNLPFSWIQIQPDHAHVCFQYGEQKWQYRPDGVLEEWHGDFGEADPRFLKEEVPSSHSSDEVTVKFINRSGTTLSLLWIDFDGNPVHYSSLEANGSSSLGTYAGHVWRIVEQGSEKVQAIYRVPRGGYDTVIIGRSEASLKVFDEKLSVVQGTAVRDQEEFKEQEKINESEDQPQTPAMLPLSETSPKSESIVIRNSNSAGQRGIFVEDHNLFLRDADGGKTQLSSGGSVDNTFEEGSIYLTSDAQFAIAWQYTPEQAHIVNLVESTPKDQLEPKLKPIQYLKPGDRRRVDRPRLYDLNNAREVPTDDSLFSNHYNLHNLGWSKDEQEYRFVFNERGHQKLRLLSINREGFVRVLIEDKSETFINYSQKMDWKLLGESEQIVWASERDGFNHLYLYDMSKPSEPTQLTRGNWNVHKIEEVDTEQGILWLRAYGIKEDADPYHAYLVRVSLDGSGYRTITDNGDGTHSWTWSPNKRYVLDTWSRVDLPPHVSLRDANSGEELVFLEKGDLQTVEGGASWNMPERFVATGRDGTTNIYGIIIRPSDFDETKSYPILEDLYAGPHDFFTPKAFSKLSSQREWANEGYILVQLDGMGTNWRSKQFHDVCHKNLKDAGLPDRVAWIKAAASTRPWMDLSRVGVYGVSAGGQSAAAALLHHGDFYKVAAADSGCHDNRMDKMWWNEQWMGYPVDQAYVESSNATHAGKLTGKLMLIVGELDDNVDPSSTLQLVHALNEADKDYELLVVPGGGHGCGGSGYPLRRQRDFFRRHLRG